MQNFVSLKNLIQFHIVPIRNIDHYALWPHHVQQYLPIIHDFYSGSPLVLQLWKNSFSSAQIFKIQKNIDISGTKVRDKIKHKKQEYEMLKYFLPSTIGLISQFDLSNRLQNMETS